MIDCADYRRALLADPADAGSELRAHRDGCADCARFTVDLVKFEARLARATRLRVEPALAAALAPVPLRPTRRRLPGRSRLALAASVLLGVGVVTALWLAAPEPTLADDVVAHMAEEPQAWRRTDVAVSRESLAAVLRNTHVRLAAGAGLVSYANSCLFRGHHVPHFVVQTGRGPVTVMILVHEGVAAPVHFDESGYHGIIVPVPGHGAMAVLTRGADDDLAFVERAASRLLASVVWTK